MVSLSTRSWWKSDVTHQINVLILFHNLLQHLQLSNWSSLIRNQVQVHVVTKKSVDTYKSYILIGIWLVNSINFETFLRHWTGINLMIRKVLIISWGCEDVFCVDFFFNFILNKLANIFDSLRSFLPFIMSWIISSDDNNIDFINVLLDVIKSLIKQFDWRITFYASKFFRLNRFSLRESILNMTTNGQITNCWSFLCVIQIQMNISQMENFQITCLLITQNYLLITGLPFLLKSWNLFQWTLDITQIKSLVKLWSTKFLTYSPFFQNTSNSCFNCKRSQLFSNILTKFFWTIFYLIINLHFFSQTK